MRFFSFKQFAIHKFEREEPLLLFAMARVSSGLYHSVGSCVIHNVIHNVIYSVALWPADRTATVAGHPTEGDREGRQRKAEEKHIQFKMQSFRFFAIN